MRSYLNAIINLFYPKACVGCGVSLLREEEFLCVSCEMELPINPFLEEKNNELKTVFAGRLPLVMANTFLYFSKNGIAQRLIHSLKYEDRQDVGRLLGYRFGQELAKLNTLTFDGIIPLPLHPNKEKSRGYNQCLSIAEGLSEALNCVVLDNVVQRDVENPSQTKLNRAKRWDNVRGIFSLINPDAIANKHVLLIDDTLTTGATLESCGTEILKGSGTKLSIATLAYAK